MKSLIAPDQIYAELFEAVQLSHIFPDSKTFVDAVPKSDPAIILKSFEDKSQQAGFDLSAFVQSNFSLPLAELESTVPDNKRTVREHIDFLWDELTRTADTDCEHSSLIALPHSYIVPGGRFREIYYWDSYFTMLGLAAGGRIDLVANMVANFAFLIEQIGFIPNGNRSYFCTRSQPPLFALMVELLASIKQDQNILELYLPQIEKEYDFWMSGSNKLVGDAEAMRRVLTFDGGFLNRYWDNSDRPRQESYAEDFELAQRTSRDSAGFFRDIRAACESGWDFSSRWLENSQDLGSIRTTQIVPVDLNSILCKVEFTLAQANKQTGDTERASLFESRAIHRKKLIQNLFFDSREGFFRDLLLPDMNPGGELSLAAAYPLFFGLATQKQAEQTTARIHADFLKRGGWVTTLTCSGQQWDAPIGWAPMQWITFIGLRNFGFEREATAGARNWVKNNLEVYRGSGKFLEKYNVEEIGKFAEGGEYQVQDGFGWTNGVLIGFMDKLGID